MLMFHSFSNIRITCQSFQNGALGKDKTICIMKNKIIVGLFIDEVGKKLKAKFQVASVSKKMRLRLYIA